MCVPIDSLVKKYSISSQELMILASKSGAYIDRGQVCGNIDEKLILKYKEIQGAIENDEIVELDDVRLKDVFKKYNIITAYNSLFITRRIPVPSNILSRFPDIKKHAVLLGNTYYVSPIQFAKLQYQIKKEKERLKTITINIDDIDEQ